MCYLCKLDYIELNYKYLHIIKNRHMFCYIDDVDKKLGLGKEIEIVE